MLFVALLLFHTFFAGTLSLLQVKSFGDFLEYNHLNHGIIIMCNDGTDPWEELKTISTKSYWLSFFNAHQTSTDIDVANFKDMFYRGSPKVGISLDVGCQSEAVRILEAASLSNFFNSSQAWFVIANSTAEGLKIFERMDINIDADITLGVKVSKDDTLWLYDLYKVCHRCDTALQIVVKGSWSKNEGMVFDPFFRLTSVRRRMDFANITLSGGVVISTELKDLPLPLNEYIESFKYKHLDAMQRKSYHLLKILQDMYNFRLKVVFTDSWGIEKDGNWSGVMGSLLNGEVDLSLTALRFTPQRVLAVRYLPEVHVEIIRFLFRHPRRSPVRNIFLQPFTTTVWYTVLALIAVGIILMAITMRQEGRRNEITGSSENKLDFFTLIILEAIFLQGPSQMFQLVSTRTLIFSICIFAVMLFQFYSAFIVGYLLADVARTIVNYPALFNSSLDIGMEDISYSHDFFNKTTNQLARDIYVHRIMKNPRGNILPLQKGLQRIGKGGYAYYVAVVRAYRILKDLLTESKFCDLQEIALDPPFQCCPAVPHDSPYKEHFARAILQLRENGLMSYHDKLWSFQKPQCTPEMIKKDTTVEMEHFLPALGFLVVAMATSLFVFGMEILVHWVMCYERPLRETKHWLKCIYSNN